MTSSAHPVIAVPLPFAILVIAHTTCKSSAAATLNAIRKKKDAVTVNLSLWKHRHATAVTARIRNQ